MTQSKKISDISLSPFEVDKIQQNANRKEKQLLIEKLTSSNDENVINALEEALITVKLIYGSEINKEVNSYIKQCTSNELSRKRSYARNTRKKTFDTTNIIIDDFFADYNFNDVLFTKKLQDINDWQQNDWVKNDFYDTFASSFDNKFKKKK